MRTYDDKRWIKNEDGSFSRKPPQDLGIQIEVLPGVLPADDPVYAKQEENANYYKDISTTGAAADLAQKLGVDLSEVEGTGLHGKITKADVQKAADAA